MTFLFITIRVLVTILIIASVIDRIFLTIFWCHLPGPSTSFLALWRISMSWSILSSARSLAEVLRISMIGKIFIFWEIIFLDKIFQVKVDFIQESSYHYSLRPLAPSANFSNKSKDSLWNVSTKQRVHFLELTFEGQRKNTVDQLSESAVIPG